MRREAVYLEDIVQAADEIAAFAAGRMPDDLENDAQLRNAILFSLTVIGEAANSLPADFHARRPEVRWRDIILMRNRIVHGYFSLDPVVIWQIATIHSSVPPRAGRPHSARGIPRLGVSG
jgi:uncharacterized protein with HEPN domain